MLRQGQIQSVNNLCNVVDVKGKRVLEIGGDSKYEVANLLLEKGVAHVTTTNIGSNFPTGEVNEKLSTVKLDATQLTSKFSEGTFDIAFGVAILEHMNNLSLMLDQLYNVLKSGAVALLHGGPIWSSRKGHHIWVKSGQNVYRFSDQNTNPIPDWYHLLLNYDEMIEYLIIKKELNPQDAYAIAEHVYKSPNLSRKSYFEIVDAFDNSKFYKFKMIESCGPKPSVEMLEKLSKTKWKAQTKFGVSGLEFILRKSKSIY
jgi:hypothetical protein